LQEISKDYDGKQIIAVGLLKGSILFMADLIRQLTVPAAIDFICVSSYVDTTSTGNIIMKKDLDMPVEGAHILVVEDLIDTGNTLAWIIDHIKAKKPASLKLCTLLNKEERRKVEIAVDYNGFMVEDKFVVGYGMDFNEQFRTLPYIGVLKPSAYRK
jgi:hypoxanthine phosphoribosyltransferase